MLGIDGGDISLPGVAAVVRRQWLAQPFEIGKLLAIKARPTISLLDESIELGELNEADRGLNVGHPVIETEFVEGRQQIGLRSVMALLLRYRRAVVAHHVGAGGEIGVVRHQHAALAGA